MEVKENEITTLGEFNVPIISWSDGTVIPNTIKKSNLVIILQGNPVIPNTIKNSYFWVLLINVPTRWHITLRPNSQ